MCPIFNGCGDTAVWMLRIKALQKVWRKDKWRIDCIYWLYKWSQYIATVQSKCSKIRPLDFNALFNPFGNSTCSSHDVVLALLFYEGSTVHNANDQFVSCVYFFFVNFAFHPSPQTKNLICKRQLQTAVSSHPLETGHMFTWTYLLWIVHTTTS